MYDRDVSMTAKYDRESRADVMSVSSKFPFYLDWQIETCHAAQRKMTTWNAFSIIFILLNPLRKLATFFFIILS